MVCLGWMEHGIEVGGLWDHLFGSRECVGNEYRDKPARVPITLRIKVVRTTTPPDMYIGIANSLALRRHA